MKIKPNDIVELSNKNKILIIDLINFMNHDFIFANEILPDESDVTNKYKIMVIDYNRNTLQKVTNVELLTMILPQFEERLRASFN